MTLANETGQAVDYWINSDGAGPDSGTIEVDGSVDLPQFDNQFNVVVTFTPSGAPAFSTTIANTGTGQQVEMALVVE